MSIPDNATLADLAAAIYEPRPVGFDHVVQVSPYAPFFGVVLGDDWAALAARGTRTAPDYWRDLRSETGCALDGPLAALGLLPHGFAKGLAENYAALAPLVGDRVLYGSVVPCGSAPFG